jgi:hypothetical protein
MSHDFHGYVNLPEGIALEFFQKSSPIVPSDSVASVSIERETRETARFPLHLGWIGSYQWGVTTKCWFLCKK